MPRPRIHDEPMTATERSRRRRETQAAEIARLRDENQRLRELLAGQDTPLGILYTVGFDDGRAAERAENTPNLG